MNLNLLLLAALVSEHRRNIVLIQIFENYFKALILIYFFNFLGKIVCESKNFLLYIINRDQNYGSDPALLPVQEWK